MVEKLFFLVLLNREGVFLYIIKPFSYEKFYS